MDPLWAPWRLAYVAAPKPPFSDEACFICRCLAGDGVGRRHIGVGAMVNVEQHGLYLSNSGDGHIVRRCTIFNNSANGIHINSDASQGGDGVITGVLQAEARKRADAKPSRRIKPLHGVGAVGRQRHAVAGHGVLEGR